MQLFAVYCVPLSKCLCLMVLTMRQHQEWLAKILHQQ